MLWNVTRCTGRISARSHRLRIHWGEREMGTAISRTECSLHGSSLIQRSVKVLQKYRLFVQYTHIHAHRMTVQWRWYCLYWGSASTYRATLLCRQSQMILIQSWPQSQCPCKESPRHQCCLDASSAGRKRRKQGREGRKQGGLDTCTYMCRGHNAQYSLLPPFPFLSPLPSSSLSLNPTSTQTT